MPKLSLAKLTSLVEKHGYCIDKFYCEKKDGVMLVKLLQCNTPVFQKRFLIRIPCRYEIKIEEDDKIVRIHEREDPPQRQVNYIINLKSEPNQEFGSLTCSGLLVVTKDSQLFWVFSQDDDSDDELEEEVENVEKIEKKAEELLKIDTTIKLPVKEEEPVDPSSEKIEVKESGPDVELVFEDEEGNSVDEVKTYVELSDDLDNVVDKELIEDDDNSKYISDIGNSPTAIGDIFIVFPLSEFVKNASKFEEYVSDRFRSLGNSEKDGRITRLTKVHKMVGEFVAHSVSVLNGISVEESKLDAQSKRLSIILKQTMLLLEKIELNPGDYDEESKNNAIKLNKETKAAISELNIELIRLRDRADTLLTDYDINISDLLEM